MNKELQDKVWAVLPNEFREEVKKIYNDLLNEHITPDIEDGVNNRMLILEEIFSYHNLTSDAEKSTNVSSKPRFKFGDKVKSISDGQTGTVLKIDKSRYPQQYIVVYDNSDGLIAGYFTESDLEPYTEPHNVEGEEVSKPTHSFGIEEEKSEPATSTLPIRLQVATAAMQGLLNATSVERFTLRIKPSAIAKAAVEYADALLAECGYEKKGD